MLKEGRCKITYSVTACCAPKGLTKDDKILGRPAEEELAAMMPGLMRSVRAAQPDKVI
jgi:hypothetical protein